MLDFRLKSIVFQINGEWYSLAFRVSPFGRITNACIQQGDRPEGLFYICDAKVEPQNKSTWQEAKMLWGLAKYDFIKFLRKLCRGQSNQRRKSCW